MESVKSSNHGKWMTMTGVVLILSTTGMSLIWSNLSVYTLSLVIARDHNSLWGVTNPWFSMCFTFFRNFSWFLVGLLSYRIPGRVMALIGILCSILAYTMAYFCVQHSLLLLTVTFGVARGTSVGILSGVCLQYAVELAGGKSGLYTAIARGSMVFATIPINAFITLYANPENEAPDISIDGSNFFSQTDILDAVPNIYLILGSIFAFLQTIGFFMLRVRKSSSNYEGASSSYTELTSSPQEGGTSQCPQTRDESLGSLQTHNPVETSIEDYTIRDMVRSRDFYILVVSIVLGFCPFMVRFRYMKAYGELYIRDDFALTILVNVVIPGVIGMGIVWGLVIDKYGSKLCLIAYHSSVAFVNFIFYFSPILNPWAFYIAAFITAGVIAPFFTLHAGIVANLFGRSHYTANLGLVLCASSAIELVSAPILGVLLDWGWFYLYAGCAVFSLMALIMVMNLTNRRR